MLLLYHCMNRNIRLNIISNRNVIRGKYHGRERENRFWYDMKKRKGVCAKKKKY